MKRIDSELFRLPANYPDPRSILLKHFPSIGSDYPITGGWGYTKDDAIVFTPDADNPVEMLEAFGVSLEYEIVPKRFYEEVIISRKPGEKFAGIRWDVVKQSACRFESRSYDVIEFNVTMFHEEDWERLRNDWESHGCYQDDPVGREKHMEMHHALMCEMKETFWFDITAFY